MGFLKNIKKKIFPVFKKNKESYLYTKVIYNSENNFIILVSFSQDYFLSVIELLNACAFINNINVKYMQSSYEKENKDGSIQYYIKHYLLIGGDDSAYIELYNKIDTIDNSIIEHIKMDISMYRDISKYANSDIYLFNKYNLLNNSINGIYALYNNINTYHYNEPIKSTIDSLNLYYKIDDIEKIKSSIPDCFTSQSLLRFIYIDLGYYRNNLYSCLNDAFNKNIESMKKVIDAIRDSVLSLFILNPSDTVLKNYIGPQYLVNDGDDIAGSIDDESLDEIFRQEYDRFNAINSDDIEYKDIDEEFSSEEIYKDWSDMHD